MERFPGIGEHFFLTTLRQGFGQRIKWWAQALGINKMTESFAELFEESLATQQMKPGTILTGSVVSISPEAVIVHAGLKSEAVIPAHQFRNEKGEMEVEVGDKVEVALDAVEDGFGETRLSREKAKRARTWSRLEESFNNQEIVTGVITGRVKDSSRRDQVRARLAFSQNYLKKAWLPNK